MDRPRAAAYPSRLRARDPRPRPRRPPPGRPPEAQEGPIRDVPARGRGPRAGTRAAHPERRTDRGAPS